MPELNNSEPDDAGADHEVPADATELHEALEWQAAVEAESK